MRADSPLWRVMGDSAQAQEAEALEAIRKLLPDDGVARAWANVTFTDSQGRLNEVDVLIVTKSGVIVTELKGWHGEIAGNQQAWHHNGHSVDNPRKLANLKAKRLAGVLKDVAASEGLSPKAVPFVTEAVVLHGRDSVVKLDQYGAEGIYALDGFQVKMSGGSSSFSSLLTQSPRDIRDVIDLTRAKQLDILMDRAGLMPRAKQRMIGQYALDSAEPLGEGPGWQDFLVTHPKTKIKRRIRLFAYPKGAGKDTRAEIDRRAERELRLTDGIRHPGIIGPLEYISTEEGAALVFAHDDAERSLAAYLEERADRLTFEDRERLVQQLAELVRFAHGQRLNHRALSPVSVRVLTEADGTGSLAIRDWDLARRANSGTTTATIISRGVTEVAANVEQDALLYLAPETLRGMTAESPYLLDVYGVGALAHLILTQRPPATNLPALEALVSSGVPGLDPRAVLPEISDEIAQTIIDATAFQPDRRTIDSTVFVEIFAQARRSDRQDDEPQQAIGDPLDAADGEVIDERFIIEQRRGSGSTGVALQVTDYDRNFEHVILKLAKDDSAGARLVSEAAVLDRLDHPRIVKRLDGPLAVGTRQGLLLTDAGKETLSDRIRLEGRATIEQLERWSADLFEAVEHLEHCGVFHRDIKPSNLAVKPDPATRKPRLTLFDFSLSEEPLENIRSGSRPYLDPYLGSAGRSQFDSAAERFAIAVSLFELATAYPIWWPSGDAPMNAAEAAVVEPSSFDPAVADGLAAFFRVALSPLAADRHPSLAAMQAAWATALAGADAGQADDEANDELADAATLSTLLTDAGLSARALSALARQQVATVGELLGVPPMVLNSTPGLGVKVRREIQDRIRSWRQRLSQPLREPEQPVAPGRRSVESLLASIAAKPDETRDARFKRITKNSTLTGPTDDLARWLSELGNVATLGELAPILLREYGSTLSDDAREPAAIDLLRTILDRDSTLAEPRFVYLTSPDRERTVVAYAPEEGGGLSFDEAEIHLETLLAHAAEVDQLLADSPVVTSTRLRETVAATNLPALRLSDARAAQLAISLSATGHISSMGEAYRAALDPATAVAVALRGAAAREMAVHTIEQRVRARFPTVTQLPQRPALDTAVRQALPYLEWRDTAGRYLVRDSDLLSRSHSYVSTTMGPTLGDPLVTARLAASLREHGALTLMVSRSKPGVLGAAKQLADQHGMRVIDLADVALDALKHTATEKGVNWPTVLRADAAAEGSHDRANLLQLARLAITPVWADVMASEQPLVLVNAAVLARLGLIDLISQVTDLATPRPAARWFVLPRPLNGQTPDFDGYQFPFGADGAIALSGDAVRGAGTNSEPQPVSNVPMGAS